MYDGLLLSLTGIPDPPLADDLVVKAPTASAASLPDYIWGKKGQESHDGIRADDRQAERPDPAQGRGVPLDEAGAQPHRSSRRRGEHVRQDLRALGGCQRRVG